MNKYKYLQRQELTLNLVPTNITNAYRVKACSLTCLFIKTDLLWFYSLHAPSCILKDFSLGKDDKNV